MFDYRLFYPHISIEDDKRARRPLHGHPERRVYQVPPRRGIRLSGRATHGA